MQTLVKEVLALAKSSEAAQWRTIESKILSNLGQFNKSEVVQVTYHFGLNKQGSQQYWQTLDSHFIRLFPQLTINETELALQAFGEANHEPSAQLNSILLESYTAFGNYQLEKQKEQDPYYERKFVDYIWSILPENLRPLKKVVTRKGQEDLVGQYNYFSVVEFQNEQEAKQFSAPVTLNAQQQAVFAKNKELFEKEAKELGISVSDIIQTKA